MGGGVNLKKGVVGEPEPRATVGHEAQPADCQAGLGLVCFSASLAGVRRPSVLLSVFLVVTISLGLSQVRIQPTGPPEPSLTMAGTHQDLTSLIQRLEAVATKLEKVQGGGAAASEIKKHLSNLKNSPTTTISTLQKTVGDLELSLGGQQHCKSNNYSLCRTKKLLAPDSPLLKSLCVLSHCPLAELAHREGVRTLSGVQIAVLYRQSRLRSVI
eukprot:maker-scaffold542_size141805-snap-gene-0.12 protein:Tk09921 transcript:maker-scaffold542_size141805-snap-gene-0.12-mRNA-1 annotation:"hypothetical protein"